MAKKQNEMAVGGGVIYALAYLYSTGVTSNRNIWDIVFWVPNYLKDLLIEKVPDVANWLPNTILMPIITFIVGFIITMILVNIKK